ncbi:MFS transporter [Solimicrobium silvestre]|uniref:Multidrug transporter MdfA n=1 Tax=Solimicrobium silvestre TaxID=2099400 RepID=A0A2S9GYT7_9BURK|nr:MFS transporter [Solimicrobium silvestre]PRC92884.1 Major Facilitator Superfamily [Solimicrobium silvestre]
MYATSKINQLNRATLLFPFALVLFEFAVYIANDMAQPAMLMVTQEFGVDASWVPLSMTAFLIGGASLSWLTGPLSDRIGRRPVLLGGILYFILACLATYLVSSIEAFMALRVLQGIGLCFINAVGYAAVQEAFEEKSAVKVTAMMANVALIAPMAGPLAGAALIQLAPWRSCFLFIAAVSFISLVGLWRKMPETVNLHSKKLPFSSIGRDYLHLFSQRRFVLSALTIPLISMPLIGWIALSPVLLVNDYGMSLMEYGFWQLPILGSLVVGNVCVIFLTDRWPLGRSALLGIWPILLGILIALFGVLVKSASPVYLVIGISLIAFAEGLSFAVLYRFTLMSSEIAKGSVSAGLSMLTMGCYAIGIELMRLAYVAWGITGFTAMLVVAACAFILISQPRIRHEMAIRADNLLIN